MIFFWESVRETRLGVSESAGFSRSRGNGVQARRRYLPRYLWLCRPRLAPERIKRLHPSDVGRSIGPGTAKTERPCSRAWLAVIRAPLRAGASTTRMRPAHADDNTVAQRERLPIRDVENGKLGDDGSIFRDLIRQSLILGWVHIANAGSQDGKGPSFRGDGGFVSGCIDTASETTDDRETGPGQLKTQVFGLFFSIVCGPARPRRLR